MARIQELQNEVNCMNDSRDFKDAESECSGQLSHVPSQTALFPLPSEPGGMLSRDKICRLMYGIRMVYRETFLLVYMRVLRHLMQECSIFWDFDATGNIPVQASTGRTVAESDDQRKFQRETSCPLSSYQDYPSKQYSKMMNWWWKLLWRLMCFRSYHWIQIALLFRVHLFDKTIDVVCGSTDHLDDNSGFVSFDVSIWVYVEIARRSW